MAHVYRAFFAPMNRMNAPSGVPTKVPFLFNTILRRLLNDYQPDYIGIVFDPPGKTFRDELFDKYKAHRQPMPDEMIVQLPLVRRLCEALRLPILEFQGYEADDVIGTLAHQAAGKDFDVWIVSNDKDMMQLVGSNIYVLRPGTGGEKNDVFVDTAKVTELMGVTPEKVVDVMALMGDSVDNIPGARDPNEQPDPVTKRRTASIGEVGAKELIQRFGSAEETLRHADEVSRATYRTALQKHGEFVRMSKELARISQDAAVSLDLPSLARREPDLAALSAFAVARAWVRSRGRFNSRERIRGGDGLRAVRFRC